MANMSSELLEQFLPPPALLLPHQLPLPAARAEEEGGGSGGLSARGAHGLGVVARGRFDGGCDGLAMLAHEALQHSLLQPHSTAARVPASPRGDEAH